MRPGGVVLLPPGIDRRLGGGQVRERDRVIEQLAAQAAVEPLDLAGGGRCRARVSRRMMPLSRQIRPDSTSPPLPNRSVNCLPLSVSTSSGTPKAASAAAKARHTARPVARTTTWQITQYREWSSIPVTILASVPSARNAPPMMSICHSAMAASRSHRW
jgi:hypothetical protein